MVRENDIYFLWKVKVGRGGLSLTGGFCVDFE